jgi:prevent-host-death family protein
MAVTTFSSRDFNQYASEAKKAADKGPVFITDRGKPAHVLLSIEQYWKLAGGQRTLAEALAQENGSEIDFDPPRIDDLHRLPDLT